MSFVHTKQCRDLIKKKEKLESESYLPPVRHLIYLIDDYIAKEIKLELLRQKKAQVEERIFCAKEFVGMLRST